MADNLVSVARAIARKAGIDPDLFVRQITQESGFNPTAHSPAGAEGIAQIVPKYHPNVDPMDPVAALTYAANWMSQLLAQYGGDWSKALAHYNGGGGAVKELADGHPYGETRAYLNAILGGIGPHVAEAAELDPSDGGTPMAQPQQAIPAGSPGAAAPAIDPTLQRIVAKKGAWLSAIPLDPEIKNPTPPTPVEDARGTYQEKIPNKTPTYRYTFEDGTHVDVKSEWDTGPNGESRFTVVGGTALGSLSKEEAKGTQPPKVTEIGGKPFVWDDAKSTFVPAPGLPSDTAKPTGNKQVVTRNGKAYVYDPETGAFTRADGLPDEEKPPVRPTTVNTSASEPFIVQQMPDGTISKVTNPNYVPPRGPQPTVHVAGNRVVTVGPDGQLTTQVIDPEAQALDTQTQQLQLQKAQQALMPAQLLAIQNHHALVQDLSTRVAKGEMTPQDADTYVQQSKAYTDAALQGTTPFQLEKQRQDNERAAQQTGAELLNQRMTTGANIASSVLSAASNLAQHSLFAPGQTSFGVDPLAIAKAYSGDLGGGPEVTDFARNLLMGAKPRPAGL